MNIKSLNLLKSPYEGVGRKGNIEEMKNLFKAKKCSNRYIHVS
jgi:hypothetical protein